MAKTKEILAHGQLTQVTEFDHSAQEIDDAVTKVKGGPAALGVMPGASSTQIMGGGEKLSKAGWYRIITTPSKTHGNPMLLCLQTNYWNSLQFGATISLSPSTYYPKIQVITCTEALVFTKIRLMQLSNSIAVDVYYSLDTLNQCSASVFANRIDDLIAFSFQDFAPVEESPSEESVLTSLTFTAIPNGSVLTTANGYGPHNKPSGSYTGNGSATSRTIDTGGIGKVVFINSANGSALVGGSGALCFVGTTVTGLWTSEAKFINGVLTLATANTYVNASNVTYNYQVL